MLAPIGAIGAPVSLAPAPPAPPAAAPATPAGSADLLDLSLEELMDVRITSVSKKEQSIGDVAAAVFVLSSEDLRRSGATSIPDALRLVPGLQVAHIDANKWAISARGFSDRFANKLLVLVDGRSIYTHLFSGVFWESLDLPFELIDRIEVIRGPGASIWGANAVTGVINIITKPAESGSYVSTGFGAGIRAGVTGIAGREIRPGMQVRAHGLYSDRSRSGSPGDRVDDSWQTGHAGFRLDWARNPNERITLIAEAGRQSVSSLSHIAQVEAPYDELHASTDPITDQSGLLRWSRQYFDGNEISVQSSYQLLSIDIDRYLAYCEHTFSLEGVNRLRIGHGQELMAGVEYRFVGDHVDSTEIAALDPKRSTARLWSAFLQDEWRALDGRVITTAGAKFERYRGEAVEVQPDLRMLFHPSKDQAIWAAVSKAIRTPARVEEALRYRATSIPPDPSTPGAPAVAVRIEGDPEFGPERLLAYDAGYRISVGDGLSVDLTGFHDRYRRLRSNTMGNPRLVTDGDLSYLEVPVQLVNENRARTEGGELLVRWRACADWRLSTAYSLFRQWDGVQADSPLPALLEAYPRRMWFVQSQWNPSPRWELDLQVRACNRYPMNQVPSSLTGDARIGYRWSEHLRTDLLAQNLLAGPHREFAASYSLTELTLVHPGYGLRMEWRP